MTVELVVLAPVIVLFGMTSLALGRYELVRERAIDAAHAGAEAAAVAWSPDSGVLGVREAVNESLLPFSRSCRDPAVATDADSLADDGAGVGGVVHVRVTCTVPLSEFGIPGMPGSVTVDVTQSAPVDPYRTIR
ncbi:MAG TPA: TadE/TadG family type IV pilus assembly protein [Acidimicrobiales bacterium]|nr:TadE/TadG family type IV pilus assembly protein [Acidimicrobiales bacterium]